MKRKAFSIIAILLLLLAVTATFARNGEITVVSVFGGTSIAKSANSSSTAVDLAAIKPEGHFSLQIALSGSGTAKGEYTISNDGNTYIEPSSATDIFTGLTATGGPGSDGKNIYPFHPELARYIKIKITETGGSSSITVTATLAIQ